MDASRPIVATIVGQIERTRYADAVASARAALRDGRGEPLTVHLLLGRSLAMLGRTTEARRAFETVRERAGEHDAAGAAALEWLCWLAWVELDRGLMGRCVDAMAAHRIDPTSPEAFRLFVRQASTRLQLGAAADAHEVLVRAESVARDGDIDTFTAFLSVKADVLSALGESERALSHARLATDIAEHRSDPYARWRHHLYLGYIQYANGLLEYALASYTTSAQIADAGNLTWETVLSRARAAYVAFLMGRVTESVELLRDAFARRIGHRWARAGRSASGIVVGLAAGDDALLRAAFDEDDLAAVLDGCDYYSLGVTAAAYHAYFRAHGDESRADELLRRAIEALPSPDCGWSLFPAVAEYGSAEMIERARALIDTFPRTHRFAHPHRRLFEAILARRQGDRRTASDHAGEAQRLFLDCGSAWYAARCLEVAGRLTEAHRAYAQMGASAAAGAIAYARPHRGRPRQGFELSRRRHEVLEMLLDGASVKTIAAKLGVSTRTVKNRISEIYAAEGVTRRDELLRFHDARSM